MKVLDEMNLYEIIDFLNTIIYDQGQWTPTYNGRRCHGSEEFFKLYFPGNYEIYWIKDNANRKSIPIFKFENYEDEIEWNMRYR